MLVERYRRSTNTVKRWEHEIATGKALHKTNMGRGIVFGSHSSHLRMLSVRDTSGAEDGIRAADIVPYVNCGAARIDLRKG